ncbi:hypothetical protein V5O48_009518 [Marasmius crinis-equi]|uniref:Uncharacterized protein n=1 Tax=Marasmius crinis-equi TaxID=585013 RepID=A0ABR3FAX0_9AGAR
MGMDDRISRHRESKGSLGEAELVEEHYDAKEKQERERRSVPVSTEIVTSIFIETQTIPSSSSSPTATNSSIPASSQTPRFPQAIVLGAVIGSVVLIFLLALTLFCLCRRRRHRHRHQRARPAPLDSEILSDPITVEIPTAPARIVPFPLHVPFPEIQVPPPTRSRSRTLHSPISEEDAPSPTRTQTSDSRARHASTRRVRPVSTSFISFSSSSSSDRETADGELGYSNRKRDMPMRRARTVKHTDSGWRANRNCSERRYSSKAGSGSGEASRYSVGSSSGGTSRRNTTSRESESGYIRRTPETEVISLPPDYSYQ